MSKLTTSITRGKTLESFHEVKCFIGSLNGEKIFSTKLLKEIYSFYFSKSYLSYIWPNFKDLS